MIEKFDAFISYKHAPRDNEVADQIQKGLERFHIPAKIRKEMGRQRIERIFRDKAELPITSSLDNNISYALEHSDFLIVICSHSTKLSGWVPREIEYFLKFHPMSHVLTVLAEGEPEEVIPEQLLRATIVKLDENGEILTDEEGEPVTEEQMYEPLSCDWRLPLKQARREELPRLAAAILGCSYDELIQRSRQYRRRRLTAVLSTAAVMAAVAISYLIWSRAQIQKNYEISQENLRQAQINQSFYLANASQKILEQEHDGVGAVQLAMAALPDIRENETEEGEQASENDTRPVVPEAVYALSQAVQAYVPVGNARYPVKKYSMSSPVDAMSVNEDMDTLFLVDEAGEVGVFDILTQEKIYTCSFEDAFVERMSLLPADGTRILICDGVSSLQLIDWEKGETVWSVPLWVDEDGNEFTEISSSYAEANLYMNYGILDKDRYPDVVMALSPDQKVLAVDGANDVVRLLDMETGEETERFSLGYTPEAENEGLIQKLLWSPDGESVAALVRSPTDNGSPVSVTVYEIKTGKTHRFDTEAAEWEDLAFAGDDCLLLLAGDRVLENSIRVYTNNGYNAYLNESRSQAFCLSLADDSIRWQTVLPWTQPWERQGCCRFAPKEIFGQEAAVFAISNKGFILDMTDGTILASQDFSESVLNIEIIQEGQAIFFLSDSGMSMISLPGKSGTNMEMPSVADTGTPLSAEKVVRVPNGNDGALFLCEQENSSDVIGFAYYTDGDGIEAEKTFTSPKACWIYGDKLVTLEDTTVTGMSLESGRTAYEITFEGMRLLTNLTAPGESGWSDHLGIVALKDDSFVFQLISLSDGETEEIPIGGYARAWRGDSLYWLEKEEEDAFGTIVRFSLTERTSEKIEIRGGKEGEQLADDLGFYLSPDGSRALLSSEQNSLYLADLTDGICHVLKDEAANGNYGIMSADSDYFALVSNTMIRIYDMDAQIVSGIPTNGRNYIFAQFYGEHFYVAYANAKLFRYRIDDGTEDGVADISLYINDEDGGDLIFSDGCIYCRVGSGGGRMSTIDYDSMERINRIENCLGYSPEANCYIVRKLIDKEYHYYIYPQYTVEELIRKGKEFIGGNEMTTEMKVRYGLQ